ncbi:unnamed protein product [Phytomonas sp. Hart1]|nr:unnamed protein product [Phytomonas sp. Hart1]|eukprot:CCW71992.1 unnamed protein product [Phytomonas sp. isolate Hart1]
MQEINNLVSGTQRPDPAHSNPSLPMNLQKSLQHMEPQMKYSRDIIAQKNNAVLETVKEMISFSKLMSSYHSRYSFKK